MAILSQPLFRSFFFVLISDFQINFSHDAQGQRLLHAVLFDRIAANSRRIKGFWNCSDRAIDAMVKSSSPLRNKKKNGALLSHFGPPRA